ncbi:MAG TPA: SRPBCC domain-containing protein [Candidatus Binataceae bacterium]|nr:SRPBCC domain-containing protein [Candidatus Binataceae bacterium]
MSARSEAAEQTDLELVITRVFDAPRDLVWRAWTEPERMAQWFGPRGFTSAIERSDLRPGGAYRIYMRGPERDDHWMQGVFREVVPPHRLVMAGSWADALGKPTGAETLLSIVLEEQGAKTKLTLHQTGFESVTSRDQHNHGWNSSFDCLGDYLAAA